MTRTGAHAQACRGCARLGRLASNANLDKRGRSAQASGSACGCTSTSPAHVTVPCARRRRPIAGAAPRALDDRLSPRLSGGAISRAARVLARPTPTRRCASRVPYRKRSRHARRGRAARPRSGGRLDPDAVEVVLSAAGHRAARRREGPQAPACRSRCWSRRAGNSNKRSRGAWDLPEDRGNQWSTSTRRSGLQPRERRLFATRHGLMPKMRRTPHDARSASGTLLACPISRAKALHT